MVELLSDAALILDVVLLDVILVENL